MTTLAPASHRQARYTVDCSVLEVLDLIHSIALFSWVHRLMLNLGEPVFSLKIADGK